MEKIFILNLVKTWCDGSDNIHVENCLGRTKEEAYKDACISLHDDEEELFAEYGIELPTQSIDFITSGDDLVLTYQKHLDVLLEKIHGMGSCYYEVDLFTMGIEIEDNKIKDIKTGVQVK